MSMRLAVATALLGSLIVILSQLVFAYSLDDEFGFAVSRLSLLAKHGPAATILAAIAGLGGVFLLTVTARAPEESRPVALATGILTAGVGAAIIVIFFLVDLPDVGDTGMFDAPRGGNIDVTGSATGGLWLELVGGVILLLAGAALVVAGRDAGGSADRPGASGVRPPE